MVWKVGICDVFLFTLLAGCTQAQISNECPRTWIEEGEICYQFVATPQKTVQEASIYCQEVLHSNLVSIKSERENSFVQQWTKSYHVEGSKSDWLTSGVKKGPTLNWQADGSNITETFFPIDEMRDEDRDDPYSGVAYDRIVYRFYEDSDQFQWGWSRIMTPGHFICQIAKEDTWKFYQQTRNFSFGSDNLDPSQWPLGPRFLTSQKDTVFFKIKGKDDAYTPVKFECDATGNPPPTYKWYRSSKNGKMEQITQSDNIILTNGELHIKNPHPDGDVNMYVCEAENEHGKILSNQTRLSYGYVGEFSNVKTGGYRGIQYQGLEIDCKPTGFKPAVKIAWYKEDTSHFVRPSLNEQMFLSKNGMLYISEVKPEEQGDYYCQVTLVARPGEQLASIQPPISVSQAITLTVKGENANTYGPDIHNKFPQVFPKPPSVGQRMEIECIAFGRLPMSYRWERLDAPMNPHAHTSDHGRRLIINNPRLGDSGLYNCVVTGEKSVQNKTLYVKMSQMPTFSYPLQNQHPDIGSEFTWTCNAISVPPPTYSWYKDGQLLTRDNDLGIEVKRNRLHFKEINADTHDGMYQCQASLDKLTWRRTSAQLRAVGFEPSFSKSPLEKLLMASVNGNITIRCQPEAAPRPELTWSHNGGGLGGNARIYPNGDLELSLLQASDAGAYTCTATNDYGTDSSSTELEILEQTVLVEQPADNSVQVNDTIVLGCKASYDVKNIDIVYSWLFYDRLIDFSREVAFSMPRINHQDGTLYITGIQFHHEGYYTCVVITSSSVVKASAFVTVLGPPIEPSGVRVESSQGSRVELRWMAPGNNHGGLVTAYAIDMYSVYEKKWTSLAQGVSSESTRLELDDGWHSYTLTEGVSPGAQFQFKVKAQNEFGYGPYSKESEIFKSEDAKPRDAPTGLGGGGGKERTLTITWEPLPRSKWGSTTVDYNLYYRRAGSSEEWRGMKHIKEPPFFDIIGKDLYYLPYEVMVQAENPIGPGPNSSVTIVYSAERMPKLTPTDVSATPLNSTAGWVAWTPVPNTREAMGGSAFAYQINYWEEPDTTCPSTLEYQAMFMRIYDNQNEGLLIGLPTHSYACVTVQFMNHAGLGPKTDPYSMGLPFDAPSYSYPRFVTISSHGRESVRVTWQGVLTTQDEESLVGYKAWVWNSQQDMRSARIIKFGPTYTGVIHELEKNTMYKLRLLAYGNGGDGKKSPDIYFTLGGQVLINPNMMDLMNSSPMLAKSNMAATLLLSFALSVFYIGQMSIVSL